MSAVGNDETEMPRPSEMGRRYIAMSLNVDDDTLHTLKYEQSTWHRAWVQYSSRGALSVDPPEPCMDAPRSWRWTDTSAVTLIAATRSDLG